ncbi:hypothetical protein ACNVED_08475 [Legionella sp. D16C41]|uniref:hypothetical protein n=1 Tax=Legionella sp. D16C41 TaxID=3402688 RepID=UPI003AF8E138
MSMIILYIPFKWEDCLFDLCFKAEKWREIYKSRNKDVKVLYYDSQSSNGQTEIKQALAKGNCQIYILGHGINNAKLEVCNGSDLNSSYQTLPIKTLGERFRKDLLIPQFHKSNTIKLFFCDEYCKADKARRMAIAFRESLGQEYRNLDIKYYDKVSIGLTNAKLAKYFYGTKIALHKIIKANEFFKFELDCFVGTGKAFRHGLNGPDDRTSLLYDVYPKEAIPFDKFTNPLIKKLAQFLVHQIQSDKILAQRQDIIIRELLAILPDNLEKYLNNELIIAGNLVLLKIKVNTLALSNFSKLSSRSSLFQPSNSKAKSIYNTKGGKVSKIEPSANSLQNIDFQSFNKNDPNTNFADEDHSENTNTTTYKQFN